MNNRQLRRAAARISEKEALKAQKEAANETEKIQAVGALEVSEARLAANRANAQFSTGPRSETGKRVASLNAVKTGLTGRTVLLPSDDAALYQQHVERFFRDHAPECERECELVQGLADTQWRLNRIPALEMAIFARGRVQFAEQFAEYDEHTAAALVDAETLIVYERQLRNLQLQEKRLHRLYQDIAVQLRQCQANRIFRVSPAKPAPSHVSKPPIRPSNGFEFLKKVEESGKRINKMSSEDMETEIERTSRPGGSQ